MKAIILISLFLALSTSAFSSGEASQRTKKMAERVLGKFLINHTPVAKGRLARTLGLYRAPEAVQASVSVQAAGSLNVLIPCLEIIPGELFEALKSRIFNRANKAKKISSNLLVESLFFENGEEVIDSSELRANEVLVVVFKEKKKIPKTREEFIALGISQKVATLASSVTRLGKHNFSLIHRMRAAGLNDMTLLAACHDLNAGSNFDRIEEFIEAGLSEGALLYACNLLGHGSCQFNRIQEFSAQGLREYELIRACHQSDESIGS